MEKLLSSTARGQLPEILSIDFQVPSAEIKEMAPEGQDLSP